MVAFECLTGGTPFKGERMMEVFQAVPHGLRPSPSQFRSDVSRKMDEWMDRALQYDP